MIMCSEFFLRDGRVKLCPVAVILLQQSFRYIALFLNDVTAHLNITSCPDVSVNYMRIMVANRAYFLSVSQVLTVPKQ